jgi:hypothetical protein
MEPYSLWFNGLVVLVRYGSKNEVRRDARRKEEENALGNKSGWTWCGSAFFLRVGGYWIYILFRPQAWSCCIFFYWFEGKTIQKKYI